MTTGGWIFSILGALIVLALIVGVIVWLASTLSSGGAGGTTSGVSAREILDRRLASGELTIEQHEQIREKLSGSPPASTPDPQPPQAASAPG